jgi:hypothetical protein
MSFRLAQHGSRRPSGWMTRLGTAAIASWSFTKAVRATNRASHSPECGFAAANGHGNYSCQSLATNG